jgi:hypothetical protein
MSEENVEIVRRANAAFNAHDLEAWAAFLDPEFEFVDHMGAVGEEAGTGLDGFRRQVQGWLETFPDFRAATEEFIDAGCTQSKRRGTYSMSSGEGRNGMGSRYPSRYGRRIPRGYAECNGLCSR